MKTTFYITLVVLLYSTTSCAQKKLTEGIISTKNQKIEVVRSIMKFNDGQPWFIHPQKNKYKGPVPLPKDNYQFPIQRKDIHVNLDLVTNIVYRVLKDKKQFLHNRNEKFGIRFIFETNGMLTDINYTLAEDTLITIAEIEEIDTALRQEIRATFTGPDYKHYVAVDYNLLRDISF